MDGIQVEVDGEVTHLDSFRNMTPAGTTHPAADWPDKWSDCIHEFNGHGIDAVGDDRDDEND